MSRAATFVAIATLALAWSGAVVAQELPIPEPGVLALVPIVDDIIIDGDLSDWVAIPLVSTTDGPLLLGDEKDSGAINWQIAALGQRLLFSALVVDDTIVAGEHGENYWNEDSVELYVNFSGDQSATVYESNIAQLTVSPVDIGNADPDALTITGNGAESFTVTGFVFETTTGWGLEVSVDLTSLQAPADGASFGLQVHANGSSGGDRDTKLIWSLADVADTSFEDPSVFGTGVFVDQRVPVADVSIPEGDAQQEPDSVDQESDVLVGDAGGESSNEDLVDDPLPAESEGDRTILIVAVASAFLLVAGALWYDGRRSRPSQPE